MSFRQELKKRKEKLKSQALPPESDREVDPLGKKSIFDPKEKDALSKEFLGVGIEIFSGMITSFALAWGMGTLLTIPYFWRIIIGTVFAIAVNALTLYRIMEK